MNEFTPGPWHWRKAENGQGGEETTLVGSPDKWVRCEYYCFGWEDGSECSRGNPGEPGHGHNHAPVVLSADGWHGSGDIVIDTNSPDARLLAAAPEMYEALKVIVRKLRDTPLWASDEVTGALQALSKAGGK